MQITEQTFYMVESDGNQEVFDNRQTAIDNLVDSVDVDSDEEEFEILEVEVGNEWSIVEMDWRSIALQLAGSGD